MGIAESIEWLQRECREGKWHLAVNVTIRQGRGLAASLASGWLARWLGATVLLAAAVPFIADPANSLPSLTPTNHAPSLLPLQQLHPQTPHPLPVALGQHSRVPAQAGAVSWYCLPAAIAEEAAAVAPLLLLIVALPCWHACACCLCWLALLPECCRFPCPAEHAARGNQQAVPSESQLHARGHLRCARLPASAAAAAADAALSIPLPRPRVVVPAGCPLSPPCTHLIVVAPPPPCLPACLPPSFPCLLACPAAMEDFIGRGDRRIGAVIKRAWELGATNDAWWQSEETAFKAWSQAIAGKRRTVWRESLSRASCFYGAMVAASAPLAQHCTALGACSAPQTAGWTGSTARWTAGSGMCWKAW